MALQPSQVTSRANSDMCRVDIVLNQRHRPSADRMAEIVRIADEFRAAVKGSTVDPLRNV